MGLPHLATFGWALLAYLIASVISYVGLYLWDPATFLIANFYAMLQAVAYFRWFV